MRKYRLYPFARVELPRVSAAGVEVHLHIARHTARNTGPISQAYLCISYNNQLATLLIQGFPLYPVSSTVTISNDRATVPEDPGDGVLRKVHEV